MIRDPPVAAFADRAVYYAHDPIGFDHVCGGVTLAAAVVVGEAEQVFRLGA